MKRLWFSRLVYAYRSRNCKRRLTVSPTAAPTAVLPSRGRDKKRFMVPEPSAEEGSWVEEIQELGVIYTIRHGGVT